jgi:hypothetical protein
MKKIGFFIGIFLLLLLANTCSASGLTLSVLPEDGSISVEPGQTISYIATVSDVYIGNTDPLLAEDVQFSINRTYQDTWWNPNWNYEFLPSTVRLESGTDSKASTLTLHVPENAIPGTYSHTVEASALNQYDQVIGQTTGRITINVIDTDVTSVPEFPTVALPVAAILGLLFIIGRKKEI